MNQKLGISFFIVSLLAGACFGNIEGIKTKLYSTWTKEECLTVMISAMSQNLNDKRNNIKVIATPYVPNVVRAITRFNQFADSLKYNDMASNQQLDALMKQGTGLYYDWEKDKEFSSLGHYYNDPTDLDSLLFLVTLINTAWPCIPPIMIDEKAMRVYQLGSPNTWPCYTPDITKLTESIFLQNDLGDKLYPVFASGAKNKDLTTDEHLFVMFHLRDSGNRHFLKRSGNFTLIIDAIAPRVTYNYLIRNLLDSTH